jgi:DNA-binding NarL/FixJ family response regulator
LTSLLEASGLVTVAGEAGDGTEAVEMARRCSPDVTLLDVQMPGQGGLDALSTLVTLTRVLVLTYSEERAVIDRALRRGATGYLVYGEFAPDELIDAVVGAARGRPHLSPAAVAVLVDGVKADSPRHRPMVAARPASRGLSGREVEIMEHIVRGRSNIHIARMLHLSEKTVKNHINHIYAKLGTPNRAQAIACWLGRTSAVERR